MAARPGVEKGRHVPDPPQPRNKNDRDPEKLKEAAKEARKWVQAGMAADAKK